MSVSSLRLILVAAALTLGPSFTLATPAWAHAALVAAEPAAGTTVTTTPADLKLTFSEKLELSFSKVAITGPDGTAVASGKPALDNGGDTLVVPLTTPLPKGTVTITWTAVAADGHKTKGSYTLGIAN